VTAPTATHRVVNALTIDVEDYFQVSAFEGHIARSDWPGLECRVEANIDRILALLDAAQVKATFFTLGWIAQHHPRVVHQIVAHGHELASHGFEHRRVTSLTPASFRDDLTRAKALLEDLSGHEIQGYRAPSFSIDHTNLWAFDVLADTGHRYSSSVYPVHHDHYGMPDAPRFAHTRSAGLIEVPASTIRLAGVNLPSSGGGYFRFLPYSASRWMIRRVNRADQRAAIFYFHPWEIDPQQPRIAGASLKSRFRHYVNLARTESRLRRLLQDFQWGRMDEVFLSGKPS
jgi:polysaccharide deacetylase family protein (PEP-CTERM system associated)